MSAAEPAAGTTSGGTGRSAAAVLSPFARRSNVIAVAGQVGVETGTGLPPGGFAEQARLTLANLERVLQAAGGSLSDVVMVRAYLTRELDLEQFNATCLQVFAGWPLPARTTVTVAPVHGLQVEVDALAVLS